MSTPRPLLSLALLLGAALAASAAAPAPAAAGDCGADYIACLNDSGATGTSDALHETECYSEYVRCVSRLLVFY